MRTQAIERPDLIILGIDPGWVKTGEYTSAINKGNSNVYVHIRQIWAVKMLYSPLPSPRRVLSSGSLRQREIRAGRSGSMMVPKCNGSPICFYKPCAVKLKDHLIDHLCIVNVQCTTLCLPVMCLHIHGFSGVQRQGQEFMVYSSKIL